MLGKILKVISDCEEVCQKIGESIIVEDRFIINIWKGNRVQNVFSFQKGKESPRLSLPSLTGIPQYCSILEHNHTVLWPFSEIMRACFRCKTIWGRKNPASGFVLEEIATQIACLFTLLFFCLLRVYKILGLELTGSQE